MTVFMGHCPERTTLIWLVRSTVSDTNFGSLNLDTHLGNIPIPEIWMILGRELQDSADATAAAVAYMERARLAAADAAAKYTVLWIMQEGTHLVVTFVPLHGYPAMWGQLQSHLENLTQWR